MKQNRFAPGTNIVVRSPEYLRENPPDAILVTAWNVAHIIMANESWFRGEWIVPTER